MTNRAAAAVLNAVLWGSGNLYLKKGYYSILAVLAHLVVYYYTYISGALAVFAPILILGSLYFAIDGYRTTTGAISKPSMRTTAADKTVCANCGAKMPEKSKFCPQCGATRATA
jgi:ribosomal protein L40E